MPFAGFEMPLHYRGVVEEHRTVRRAAGLFDVSHMGELEVAGPDAAEFLQRVTSNDVTRLRPGRAQLSILTSEQGTVRDDLLVYRRAADRFLLVVNAAHAAADERWLASWLAHSGLRATLRDSSEQTALLALQGPQARAILQPLTDLDLGARRYYWCADTAVAGAPATVSRTGYTGEDGFEVFLPAQQALLVWRRLIEGGALPAGLGARDTLRLEAGMMLCGQDMDETTTPYEAGLDWVVKLDKEVGGGDFVGRSALVRQRAQGVPRRMIGLVLEERGVPRSGYPVRQGGRGCGMVTSGTWSPTLERGIALARVESRVLDDPAPLAIEIRGKEQAARRADLPFYRRPGNEA